VGQSVSVGLFGRELSVLVPSAGDAVPLPRAKGQFLAELSVSIIALLDDSFHNMLMRSRRTMLMLSLIQYSCVQKDKSDFILFGNCWF